MQENGERDNNFGINVVKNGVSCLNKSSFKLFLGSDLAKDTP